MYYWPGKIPHCDKPHAPNNHCMKEAFMVHWFYPMHAYFFLLSQVKDDVNAAEDIQELETVAG